MIPIEISAKKKTSRHLMLFGGGPRPATAMTRFAQWAGTGRKPRILIVTWASGEPRESYEALAADFRALGVADLSWSATAPVSELEKETFLEQLGAATAVFFSGGDQTRIMAGLSDPALFSALHWRYGNGLPFGGTSAGTAIMSPRMIHGERNGGVIDAAEVLVSDGLGLLPDTIVDQHFLYRQRQNRLFGAVLAHPHSLGVGVDEGAALAVVNNEIGEAIGGQVLFADARRLTGSLVVDVIGCGESFDLKLRCRLASIMGGLPLAEMPTPETC